MESLTIQRELLALLCFYVNKTNVCRRGSNITPVLFAGGFHRGKSSPTSLEFQREVKTISLELKWEVEIIYVPQICDTYSVYRVRKGCLSLPMTTCLREGDLCLFKLMKNEELLNTTVDIIRRENC